MNERITQQEIERLLVLRTEAREARTAASKKQEELEAEVERLIAALQAGTPVEPGSYFLLTTMESTGRSVGWRKVVEEHLGKPFAEQVLATTPPREERVLKIVQEVKAGVEASSIIRR